MQELIQKSYVIYREEDQWFMAGYKTDIKVEFCFTSLMQQAYIFSSEEQAVEVWQFLTMFCREDKIQILPYYSLSATDFVQFRQAAIEEQDMSIVRPIEVLSPLPVRFYTKADETLKMDSFVQEWDLVYGEARNDWKTVLQGIGWQVQTKILHLKD